MSPWQSAAAGGAQNGGLVHAMVMDRGAPGDMGVVSHMMVDSSVEKETTSGRRWQGQRGTARLQEGSFLRPEPPFTSCPTLA